MQNYSLYENLPSWPTLSKIKRSSCHMRINFGAGTACAAREKSINQAMHIKRGIHAHKLQLIPNFNNVSTLSPEARVALRRSFGSAPALRRALSKSNLAPDKSSLGVVLAR